MSSENISHYGFGRHSWIASVGPFCQSVRYLLVLSLRRCSFVIFVCMIHFGVIHCSVPRKCLLLIYNNGLACHINIGMNEQKQSFVIDLFITPGCASSDNSDHKRIHAHPTRFNSRVSFVVKTDRQDDQSFIGIFVRAISMSPPNES